MQLKICGLKYIGNIERIIQLHPDYIGFIFYPKSKRYIGESNELRAYIRSIKEVKKVGVFVNENLHKVIDIATRYGLDSVQLHGSETASFCASLNKEIPVVKAFQLHDSFDFNMIHDYEESCTGFLFDNATEDYGGSGLSFDWQLLKQYTLSKSFLLSGGISLKNMKQVKQLQHEKFAGIDVNSCFETAPGLKDISKIKTLIHEIRN